MRHSKSVANLMGRKSSPHAVRVKHDAREIVKLTLNLHRLLSVIASTTVLWLVGHHDDSPEPARVEAARSESRTGRICALLNTGLPVQRIVARKRCRNPPYNNARVKRDQSIAHVVIIVIDVSRTHAADRQEEVDIGI